MEFYCIPEFADVHEFLAHVARRIGRLKKGGVPDVEAAAKHVLHDWNGGRITFYTHPPEQRARSQQVSAEIVSELSKGFDLGSIAADEQQVLSGLKDSMDTMCVGMEPSQPAEMEEMESSEEDSSDEEMYDSEDEFLPEDAKDNTVLQEVITVVDMKKKQSKGPKKKTSSSSQNAQLKRKFDGDVEMEEAESYNFSEYF
jgi:nuclear GTP-binding protein